MDRGIKTLIVCGVTLEVCVHTTVREANDRGYECVVLSDCVASYFPEFQRVGLEMIKAQGGTIIWTGDAEAVALGVPDSHRWDYVALVRYPSRASFLAMMKSPEYAVANLERENGCADHAIVAMRETYRKFT